MTRDEVIKYMKHHREAKVTHEYFDDDEYIYMDHVDNIHDEQGYLVEDWYTTGPGARNFMRIRKGDIWEKGWSLYDKT